MYLPESNPMQILRFAQDDSDFQLRRWAAAHVHPE